jgi:hypothetical protein
MVSRVLLNGLLLLMLTICSTTVAMKVGNHHVVSCVQTDRLMLIVLTLFLRAGAMKVYGDWRTTTWSVVFRWIDWC